MALLEAMPGTEPPPQPETHFLARLPEGVAGIRATLKYMAALTRTYKTDPEIIALARSIVRHVPEKNIWQECAAIHAWVRDCIRYVNDVEGVETIATPPQTLEMRAGDCDDKALLSGTLLQAIGYKARYLAIAFDEPGAFEHVFAEVRINQRWVPLETTEPVEFGWAPYSPFPPMIAHV